MVARSWLALAVACGGIGIAAASISPAAADVNRQTAAARHAPGARVVFERLLGWGAGDRQVGARAPAQNVHAEGVSALAVGPDGAVLLLDRLNGRVVRLSPDGTPREPWAVVTAPRDAEDLAVGADGTVAAYSPLRAKVWLSSGGSAVGEVDVPRALRDITEIGVGGSRRVVVRNAYQERFQLGSPSIPQTLAAVLHSKREGAHGLRDGTGLAVTLSKDKRPQLLLLDTTGERARIDRTHEVGAAALSARLVGVEGDVACVLVERAADGPGFGVKRSVTCLRPSTGARLFEQDLPSGGWYVPRRPLAMGGNPVRLAFMEPSADGLRVTVWAVAPRAGEVAR